MIWENRESNHANLSDETHEIRNNANKHKKSKKEEVYRYCVSSDQLMHDSTITQMKLSQAFWFWSVYELFYDQNWCHH